MMKTSPVRPGNHPSQWIVAAVQCKDTVKRSAHAEPQAAPASDIRPGQRALYGDRGSVHQISRILLLPPALGVGSSIKPDAETQNPPFLVDDDRFAASGAKIDAEEPWTVLHDFFSYISRFTV
jgi:hypothetical protein